MRCAPAPGTAGTPAVGRGHTGLRLKSISPGASMGTGHLHWHRICPLRLRSLPSPSRARQLPRLGAPRLGILPPAPQLSLGDARFAPLLSRPRQTPAWAAGAPAKAARRMEVLPASPGHRLPAGLSERDPALRLPEELWRRFAGSEHPKRVVWGGLDGDGQHVEAGDEGEGCVAAAGAWQG